MRNYLLFLWRPRLFLLFFALAANSFAFSNRIEGRVYNPERLPVDSAYVELRNEVDSPVAQTKTDTSGRFTFVGMPGGRYNVKVLPLRTNFKEQTQEVYVQDLRRGSSDTAYVDFYLIIDKRDSDSPAAQKAPGVIFAQEVPPVAKKLYEDGSDSLKKNQDKGIAKLEEAVRIYPDYFDALSLLGKEYISLQSYEKANPFLIKATTINPRSSMDFYRLSFSFYQLKQYPAALEPAKAMIVLAPDSIDAQLLYGKVLRVLGRYPDAEKTLLKANALAKENNPEIHWQLALLYNRINKNEAAVNELESFLRLVPNTPDRVNIEQLIAKLKNSGTKND